MGKSRIPLILGVLAAGVVHATCGSGISDEALQLAIDYHYTDITFLIGYTSRQYGPDTTMQDIESYSVSPDGSDQPDERRPFRAAQRLVRFNRSAGLRP